MINWHIKWPYLEPYIKNLPSEVKNRLETWPASTETHHAYIGGLKQHTLEVLCIIDGMEHMSDLPLCDMMIAGLFHDTGKVYEYNEAGTKIMPKNSHIAISRDIYCQVCKTLKIDPKESICNMILAHHGKKEWGSVNEALKLEEKLLHAADYASCKVNVIPNNLKNKEWHLETVILEDK